MQKNLPVHKKSSQSRKIISLDTVQFIKKQYPTKIPISMITGISKIYSKSKPINQDSKILKRFAQTATHLNTPRFIQYLSTNNQSKNEVRLNDQIIKKVYQGSCNSEGKITYESLMKMGEKSGFKIDEKLAKGIIKKYGKRKEFLNLQDCQRTIKKSETNKNEQTFRVIPRIIN